MKETSVIKTFGKTIDIVAIREATGADVASKTLIAEIGKYPMN